MKEITNTEFAKNDTNFQEMCKKAEIEPTTRQASKYRNKKGIVYKKMKNIFKELKEDK